MDYYLKNIDGIAKELEIDVTVGLSDKHVAENQEVYGLNVLQQKTKVSAWSVFFRQFKSLLMLILIAAALVSIGVGEMVDAIVILFIVILNAVLGFVQEYKAEKSIESLRKMSSPQSKVLRNGKQMLIDSSELTIGDVLLFEAGDRISADARIFRVVSLEMNESILTGESLPVEKNIEILGEESILANQKNMVFSGTTASKGRGKAIVVGVGMGTEIGKIAEMIQDAPEKVTHLQKDLNKLSKRITFGVLIICAIIFATNVWVANEPIQKALLIAIALSVAAIPEGLPAVVTISLGLGVKRLIKKNALIRRLSSVETLGSVNIICTDKTGTLTKNEMTVKKIFVNNQIIEVSGVGYETSGEFSVYDPMDRARLSRLLEIGILCNNSDLNGEEIIGDPTEAALLVSGAKAGLNRKELEKKYVFVDELPFDSGRKMMTVIRELMRIGDPKMGEASYIHHKKLSEGAHIVFSKGAPEMVLEKCNSILINGKIVSLNQKKQKTILQQDNDFAKDALRVLGFAYKIVTKKEWENLKKNTSKNISKYDIEDGLIFVGLQAMIDPPRAEVKEAIQRCTDAGIRVIMITGDNKVTAQNIGHELGIRGKAIKGLELAKYDDMSELLRECQIFARVNPEHKWKIINSLQSSGYTVAMTGDGVNDAPALKKSDIGIAMGITGTDISKEASDMILLDDNFSTIVNSVEEGRGIYDNIKKFVNFLLATNFGEVLIIFIATLLGMPLPLIAIQILWINLVTDGLPALALGIDKTDPNIMLRKPRKKGSKIVGKVMLKNIVFLASVITIACVYLFWANYQKDLVEARTGVFVLMVLLELFMVQVIRGQYKVPLWSNKRLFGALGISFLSVILIIYTPLHKFFHTTPLSVNMWMQILIIFGIIFGAWLVIRKVSQRKDLLAK